MSPDTTTESGAPGEEGTVSESGAPGEEKMETGAVEVDGESTDGAEAEREGNESESAGDESEDGGITEGMEMVGPLEPQEIDTENAAFLLLGVVLTAGLLLAALVGL